MVARKFGQIKIQQMAIMMIVLTIFFVFVALFIITIKLSGTKDKATALEEENAMLLVSKLAESPEFSCGEAYGYGASNCIDLDKVIILKEKNEYNGFWPVSSIEIRKIYPKTTDIECTKSNLDNCNIIKVYSKTTDTIAQSTFVSLCRKEKTANGVENKCDIAKLIVGYETKE
ncbi:MAG: hypothetical protein Q7R52_04125 [archaeon]|nr:hypothetical protein [archaeon]